MIREAIASAWAKITDPVAKRIAKQNPESKVLPLTKWIYLSALVALMAGFVSAVIFPVSNQNYFIYPSSGSQSYIETFLYVIVIVFGGAGTYMAIESGKITVKAKDSYLAIALILLLLAVILGMYVTGAK